MFCLSGQKLNECKNQTKNDNLHDDDDDHHQDEPENKTFFFDLIYENELPIHTKIRMLWIFFWKKCKEKKFFLIFCYEIQWWMWLFCVTTKCS